MSETDVEVTVVVGSSTVLDCTNISRGVYVEIGLLFKVVVICFSSLSLSGRRGNFPVGKMDGDSEGLQSIPMFRMKEDNELANDIVALSSESNPVSYMDPIGAYEIRKSHG